MPLPLILSLSRILGDFPFEDNGLSKKWLLLSATLKLINVATVAFAYFVITRKKGKISLMDFMSLARDTSVCLPLLVHSLRACFDPNFFILMNQLSAIRTRFVAAILTIVVGSEVLSYSTLFYYATWSPPRQLLQFSLIIVTLQYVLFVGVKEKQIKKLLFEIETDPISACAQLHSFLFSVDRIHDMFSLQLLFSALFVEVNVVFYGYFILKTYNEATKLIVIDGIAGCLISVVWLLAILWRCDKLDGQVKAFYAELFRVVWEQNLCSNKKLVLYLLIQRKVKFSVCGFFTIGCPLFTSIITTISTYLVILIQFS